MIRLTGTAPMIVGEYTMSEHFWEFTIQCPICKKNIKRADGYETDDWIEVFAFSGRSLRNEQFEEESKYFKCSYCGEKTEIDELYRLAYISIKSIEKIKEYLHRMVEYVTARGGLYDHYWDPDIEKAIERYSLLYPEDKELIQLRETYFYALHAPYLLSEK